MTIMAGRAFDALSQVLGDNKYLPGQRALRRGRHGIRVSSRARC